MESVALEVDGLTRRFGTVTALDNLSFSVPTGQLVGFLGPNGAGKTTTMRAIFGLVQLDAGAVRWRGEPVTPAQRRRFGYMPEERGLYPSMALGEQITYMARLHGLSAAAAIDATNTWLERLDLSARAADRLDSLSHGNQQRAQLAAALVHEPELLVLDEPLSGLDPAGIDEVASVLRELVWSGCCVVMSSHQLDLVEDLCDSVVIIDHGRLVVSGRVDELSAAGPRRLSVQVDGSPNAEWARHLSGVAVEDITNGMARLNLRDDVDPQSVLAAAMAAGKVLEFGVARRRLSEVFREAMQ